jgi:Inner membrane component of T3SS, periplasmic domain/Inner membrane component of T3SS, cytoplasmic domain
MDSAALLRRESDQEPRLQVIGGLHDGVGLILDIRDYHIGSSTRADIVLRDDNIAAEHAVLRVEPKGIRIEATGGDVGLNGGILAKGHGCRLRFPADLTIGNTRIRLTGAQDLLAVERYWQFFHSFIVNRPIFSSAGFVLAVAIVSFAAMSLPRGGAGQKPHSAPISSSINPPVSIADRAVIQLKRRLADHDLDGVKVSVAGDQLAVSGRVAKSATPEWNSVLKWFDETYANQIALASSVEIVNDNETTKGVIQLRLQAVRFGDKPYIIFDDGMRYFEGALLDNGWTVKEIGEQKITLSRGDQIIVIKYR